MSSMVMQIGSYQLENLLSQQTRFIYFDLRPSGSASDHPLLHGSRQIRPDQVEALATELAPNKEHPVVLICQTGQVSGLAAEVLERAGFINLFVVRGGLKALLA